MAKRARNPDSRKAGFPSHSLQPNGGEIDCHVFENKNIGLKRNLFWSITVNFAPVWYGDEEWGCAVTSEWIIWPIHSWKELDGRELDVKYGERGIESSFYMSEHHPAKHTRLRLSRHNGNLFRVVMDMQVEFGGFLGGDEDPAMPVHAEALVPFTSLVIVPDNLTPKPDTMSKARAVASQFVELRDFHTPEQSKHGFTFRPSS